MLIRIVKMSFKPEKITEFIANFEDKKQHIRNSSGCRLLEMYRDKNQPNVFFTYSHWDSEEDLENYRNSELFKDIWAKTKVMFNDKPLAWSLDKVASLT